jgi:hypothetical protein
MNANKINTQIERLEEELAKLKAEANKPSQYEIEYEWGSTNLIASCRIMPGNSGTDEDFLNTGRYRSTEKFTNEHFKIQNEMMRLGALVEAVTIEMNMEDWVADWSDGDQHKCHISYDNFSTPSYTIYVVFLRDMGVIYMPKEVAIRVCEILNNKDYEL